MKCRRSLTLDPKIVRGEQGAADPRRSSARQRLYRPHASGGRPSSVYWCGLQAGRDRPGNDWRVNQTKNRVRIAVSFTLKAHLCGLVPSGSLAGRSYVPVRGSRPWWSAADGCCVAARPARRVRVGLPGLDTSAVTGSMAASRLRASACSLVIEIVPEPGRTPHPAFPQSISLCSYFVATTERFYAEADEQRDGYTA